MNSELQEKFKLCYSFKTRKLSKIGKWLSSELLMWGICYEDLIHSHQSINPFTGQNSKGESVRMGSTRSQDLELKCPERIDKSTEKWLNEKSCEVSLMLQRANSLAKSRNLAIQNYSAPTRAELLPFQRDITDVSQIARNMIFINGDTKVLFLLDSEFRDGGPFVQLPKSYSVQSECSYEWLLHDCIITLALLLLDKNARYYSVLHFNHRMQKI